MSTCINVNDTVVLNLDLVSHIDLQGHGDIVRVWFANSGMIGQQQTQGTPPTKGETGTQTGFNYRDFRGGEAEAIRTYARTGCLTINAPGKTMAGGGGGKG